MPLSRNQLPSVILLPHIGRCNDFSSAGRSLSRSVRNMVVEATPYFDISSFLSKMGSTCSLTLAFHLKKKAIEGLIAKPTGIGRDFIRDRIQGNCRLRAPLSTASMVVFLHNNIKSGSSRYLRLFANE